MPKFYCEYCGIYLTHSSPSGRNQHNKGRKHQQNRQEFYRQCIEEQKDILEPVSQTQANLQNMLQGGPAVMPVPSLLPKPGDQPQNLLNMPPGIAGLATGGLPPTLQQGGIKNLSVSLPPPIDFVNQQMPGQGPPGSDVPPLLAQLSIPGLHPPPGGPGGPGLPPPNPNQDQKDVLLPPIPNKPLQ